MNAILSRKTTAEDAEDLERIEDLSVLGVLSGGGV